MTRSQPSELELQVPLHKYRKLRMYFVYPFIAVLAFFVRSTDQGFWMGIPVIVLGEAIRIWSHGYIRKAKELATNGPYAYVRNPLYVGNFLIGLGFCLIIWHPMILVFYAAGFFGLYWITIKGEEQRLSLAFKEDYQDYVKHVPRFVPRITPYQKRSYAPFELKRVTGHGEQITIFAVTALLLILYLRQEMFQKGKPLMSPELIIFNVLFLIDGLLLIGTFIHRWTKKNV